MTTATLTRTDQEVQTDVLAELRWDLSTSAKDIGVAVKDGVVTLTGTVDTYLNKWKAEQAAHRVSGVTAVANDISVRTIGERTDSDFAAAAVHALKWNTSVPAEKIHVTVDKGWVTLKGEVEWQYQKQEAERAVRGLWGVKGVSNLVTVKPLATPADLKKKIEAKGEFFTYEVYMNYSCVLLLADALERAASADRAKITAALESSTFAGHVMPYGPTKFVNGQNQGAAPVNTQVLGNDIQVILPAAFASAKAVFPMPPA